MKCTHPSKRTALAANDVDGALSLGKAERKTRAGGASEFPHVEHQQFAFLFFRVKSHRLEFSRPSTPTPSASSWWRCWLWRWCRGHLVGGGGALPRYRNERAVWKYHICKYSTNRISNPQS